MFLEKSNKTKVRVVKITRSFEKERNFTIVRQY